MPVLSFRLKLLLAMLVIVAGVTLTTLWLTQRRVQASYERMFRQHFENQIAYFNSLREARLATVKDQCLRLSQSVRLIGIMAEPQIDVADLYQNARDELREVLGEWKGQAQPGRATQRGLRAALACFLDSAGQPLLPPEQQRVPTFVNGKRFLEQQTGFIRGVLSAAVQEEVGYLGLSLEASQGKATGRGLIQLGAPASEKGDSKTRSELREVIATKIIEPTDGRTLGALVVGFGVPNLVPTPWRAVSHSRTNPTAGQIATEIQSAILLDGRLYADPKMISEATAGLLARQVTERINSETAPRADFSAHFNGAAYRVFYDALNEKSSFPTAYQVCLYPLDEALKEQKDLRWKILGSSGVAAMGAVLLSLLLSHGLAVPIRELAAGTGEIQRGNLEIRVPVRSRDEIGHLAGSFNEMAAGLALKEKYRSVLSLVADKDVAQQLMAGSVRLGGELRDVSVLFCDIRGFTALTENMPPPEVIEMLNEHMTAMTRVVYEHHGVVDKFVGDLIMAVFGAPKSYGDDVRNSALCALRMLEERTKLNETSRHRVLVGIGIATGDALAGCMGSTDRLNYTVVGERVNLASRLCGQAEAGEAWIDQTTQERLAGSVTVEKVSQLQLKGISVKVDAYKLLAVSPLPSNA
jgi:class 3 adenylate cyclase